MVGVFDGDVVGVFVSDVVALAVFDSEIDGVYDFDFDTDDEKDIVGVLDGVLDTADFVLELELVGGGVFVFEFVNPFVGI